MRIVFFNNKPKLLSFYTCFTFILLCSAFAFVGEGESAPITMSSAVTNISAEQCKAGSQPGCELPQSSPLPSEQVSVVPPKPESQIDFEKSGIENHLTAAKTTPGSPEISRFGYDLFLKPPSTFAPTRYVPVGPDYVIGPGDTIKIEVWGKIEGSWTVVVNNDGNISLPKTGVFSVTGLTFGELKNVLDKKLSKYYAGFEMNVSMGPLRTMQVYVVGNARRPGVYTISSLSTLINALFESGGPSKTGTMRTIQVKRNNKTIGSFDLYDLLLSGDKSRDLRLLPEDVIFIPLVGPLVEIAGNVKTPAVYELKDKTRLLDLIEMAGGLTCLAFSGRVQIQRIEDHRTRILFEGDLLDISTIPEKNFLLQDGDLAKIFTVADTTETVTISGAVANPGEYAIKSGMTKVSEIISRAGGLLYFTSDQAEMTRVTVTQAGPKTDIFRLDLAKATANDPEHNVALQMNDYLLVRAVPEWNLYRTATLSGEVRFPGTYTFRQGETLSSLIERAGGYTSRAYLRGAQFTREKVREQQQRQINEMAERLEREIGSSGISRVATASSPDDARMIQLELEQKRKFISQLKLARAKGRIALNVSEMTSFRGSSYDIELEQGDSLTIPSNPKTVHVIGSVYNQSAFVYERSNDYVYYVNLAGGYTSNADKSNTFILQANGTATKAGGSFLGFSEQLNSGDTVVVPEQIERVAWMREIKDLTQIIYQIAVSAGVLIVAF